MLLELIKVLLASLLFVIVVGILFIEIGVPLMLRKTKKSFNKFIEDTKHNKETRDRLEKLFDEINKNEERITNFDKHFSDNKLNNSEMNVNNFNKHTDNFDK